MAQVHRAMGSWQPDRQRVLGEFAHWGNDVANRAKCDPLPPHLP